MGSEYLTVGARVLVCVSPGARVLGTRGRPCWLLRRRPLSAVNEDVPPLDVAGSVCMCVGVGGAGACEEELFGDSKTSQLGNTAGGTKQSTQNPSFSSRNHAGSKTCSQIPSVSKSRRTAVSAMPGTQRPSPVAAAWQALANERATSTTGVLTGRALRARSGDSVPAEQLVMSKASKNTINFGHINLPLL